MHKSVMRLTIAIGAIVAAACVYDAPVKPDTAAAARSTSPSMQLAANLQENNQAGRYLVLYASGRDGGSAVDDEVRTNGGL
jgi:hypothetical protein